MYASTESHYSVFKAARMYRVQCVKVDALLSGEMSCEDFKSKLMQNPGRPAIVNVNIGRYLICWLLLYLPLQSRTHHP